jgi:hypothetical protein
VPGVSDFRAPAKHMPPDWEAVTPADFDTIAFDRLPPDSGIIAPIAAPDETPDPTVAYRIANIDAALERWPPGMVADPVQRVRNWLSVLAVPDVLQMEQMEKFLPPLVFRHLREMFGDPDLAKLLYWVAMHPDGGDDTAMRHLDALGLPAISGPMRKPRARVMLYALKFLGRLRTAEKPTATR